MQAGGHDLNAEQNGAVPCRSCIQFYCGAHSGDGCRRLSELYCRLSEPRQPETDKLVLQMKLVRRAEDFTPESCIVEDVIPLPPEEFFRLRNDPLSEHPMMEQYYEKMLSDDEGFRHGILVYDEVQGDGLFVAAEGADYARYAQYIPCAKDIAAAFEQTQTQEETAEIAEEPGGLIMSSF